MPATMTSTKSVSAYVPCYNNAKTIARTIAGIRDQTHPVAEFFVVDDGSTDNSVEIIENLGVRVVRMERNQGRGAVRARAMELAQNEFVLCCDATNCLAPNFLEIGLKWFDYDYILAVYGRWFDPEPRNTVDRWRARNLFQQELTHAREFNADLSTHGTVVRRSVVLKLGNYNPALRAGEDYDLGVRLLQVGDVVYEPEMHVNTVVHNTLSQVMERYARWNRAGLAAYSMTDFLDSHIVAWRIMMKRDFAAGDWRAALLSALMPYYSFAYAEKRSLRFLPRLTIDKVASFHERMAKS